MDGGAAGTLFTCTDENIATLWSSAAWYLEKSFTHLAPIHGTHIVERNLSVLEPLGITDFYTDTTMSYAEDCWKKMRRELDAPGVKDHYVVIQPTARQIFKCWDNDKFSKVIDALQQRGYQVVLTCGPSADDLACVDEIARGCETKPITGLAGKTRFPELGALIDHAVLFIGVDSAPGHIAAAVKTPVISLFGATDHVFWRPLDREYYSILGGELSENADPA